MEREIKRAIVTVFVFMILYVVTPILIRFDEYDVYVDALRVLGAIIGAGCYWIGSNRKGD